jgi:hypothetical protein
MLPQLGGLSSLPANFPMDLRSSHVSRSVWFGSSGATGEFKFEFVLGFAVP